MSSPGRPAASIHLHKAGQGLAFAVSLFSALSVMILDAQAFCIENNAQSRLLFMAKAERSPSPEWSFFRWLKPGENYCGKPDRGASPVEVFVFVDEDAFEGCDAHVAPTGTLRLKAFVEFDNCSWEE